jgi:NADPH:quinone reductase-like Zn-dependent oxidoreductase
LVEFALPKFVDGTFKVPIEKEFSWKEIQAAHLLMESNQSKGKIICNVDLDNDFTYWLRYYLRQHG